MIQLTIIGEPDSIDYWHKLIKRQFPRLTCSTPVKQHGIKTIVVPISGLSKESTQYRLQEGERERLYNLIRYNALKSPVRVIKTEIDPSDLNWPKKPFTGLKTRPAAKRKKK